MYNFINFDNEIDLYLCESNCSNFTILNVISAGVKDESRNQDGIAHYIEHLYLVDQHKKKIMTAFG